MADVVIFEDAGFKNLLPLVYWRAVFQLRCGKRSLLEKIIEVTKSPKPILLTRPELAEVVAEQTGFSVNPLPETFKDSVLLINGRWLANKKLTDIPVNSCLKADDTILAANIPSELAQKLSPNSLAHENILDTVLKGCKPIEADKDFIIINYPWDLVHNNSDELARECNDNTKEGKIYPGVHLLAEENIHIGADTTIKPGCVIDAEEGPIWIDENVKVLPNVVIQGPCYVGPKCLLQTNTHIREGISMGPVCKVCGELEESVIQGYSNKQHYGFLGHAYLGEWINCGAGMTNSDLKNTYGSVKVILDGKTKIDSGSMFVGVTISDHSKIGINSSFPTGAVVGASSMIAKGGYAPKFTPSFKWITDDGVADYDPQRAAKVAERVMARRNVSFTDAYRRLFLALPEITKKFENQ